MCVCVCVCVTRWAMMDVSNGYFGMGVFWRCHTWLDGHSRRFKRCCGCLHVCIADHVQARADGTWFAWIRIITLLKSPVTSRRAKDCGQEIATRAKGGGAKQGVRSLVRPMRKLHRRAAELALLKLSAYSRTCERISARAQKYCASFLHPLHLLIMPGKSRTFPTIPSPPSVPRSPSLGTSHLGQALPGAANVVESAPRTSLPLAFHGAPDLHMYSSRAVH